MAEQNVLYDGSTAPFLNEGQQALGKQTFETAVAPLRESFKEDVAYTTEDLARKGKFFGELGSQSYERLIDKKTKTEGQIAGSIATSLGQTAMDQAYNTAERAIDRQQEKDMQAAGFEFATSERLGSQEYATAERQDIQDYAAGQTQEARDYATGEREAAQEYATSERLGSQAFTSEQQRAGYEFTAEENERSRTFSSTEADLDRRYGAEQAGEARDFQASQSQLQREAAEGSQEAQNIFNERMTRLNQDFAGNEAEAQRAFNAEQDLLGRTFTSEEGALMREYQAAQASMDRELQEATLTGEYQGTQTLRASLIEAEQQRADANQMLNLAMSGNLDKETAEQMMEEVFGRPMELTTDDEATMQRIATASGLSVEDYTRMRQAVGEGQFNHMMEVDEDGNFTNLDQYIETPEKQRAFQMEIAKQQAELQTRLAETQAQTARDVAETERQSAIEVEEEKRILPSCVISTAGYQNGWIDKKDMFGFVRWRLKFQAGTLLADELWTGYQLLASYMIENFKQSLVQFIVLKWTSHMKYVIGREKFSISGAITHYLMTVASMGFYLFNVKKCKALLRYYQGVDLGKLYRGIIKDVEARKEVV